MGNKASKLLGIFSGLRKQEKSLFAASSHHFRSKWGLESCCTRSRLEKYQVLVEAASRNPGLL